MKQKIVSANTKESSENVFSELSSFKVVYLGLGTNLKDRLKNLKTALKEIKKIANITKKSSIYETDPIGYKDQGKFLNMAIEIQTLFSPIDLIVSLQEIEHKMGRIRTIKGGPRIIDLDILLYGNEIIDEKNLKIPHIRMHERKFILEPLNEIAPKVIHPKLNLSINTLWTKIKSQN